MNTRIAGLAFVSLAAAAGCTRPASVSEVPTLDAPALITARGAKGGSRLEVHRQGSLDPSGSQLDVVVSDAQLSLRALDGRAILETLDLALDSIDLPPSADLPDGLKLRGSRLYAAGPVHVDMLARTPDALTARFSGSLKYATSMVLPDGTLYPLAPSDTEISNLDVNVARAGEGFTVTVDAAPATACFTMADLVTLSSCTLFAEADAVVAPVAP